MEEFINKIRQVEMIESTLYYTEFVNGFMEIREWASVEGLSDEEKFAKYEIDICSFMEKNPILSDTKETRLVPKFVIDNKRIPEIENFTDDQFLYYLKRLHETKNIFLKVRYSDFLFEYKNEIIQENKYTISRYLTDALLETCSHYQLNKNEDNFIKSISRLIEVSLSMNDEGHMQEASKLVCSQLIDWRENCDSIWVIELSHLLRIILDSKFRNCITVEDCDCTLRILTDLMDTSYKKKDYYFYRLFVEELIKYDKFEKYTAEQIKRFRLQIGLSFELEADYQGERKEKSLITKIFLLEEALNYYKNIGESEKVNQLKIQIKQNNKLLNQSDEMRVFKMEFEIPEESINMLVDEYICLDNRAALEKLAKSNEFIPNVISIRQKNIYQDDNFLLSHVSTSIINNGNTIVNANNEKEQKHLHLIEKYVLDLNVKVEIFLRNVFRKLIEQSKLSSNDLMDIFNNWGMLDSENYSFVKFGIEKFFEEDYISCIHILVPQFESTLRRYFEKIGFATTSIKQNNAQFDTTFTALFEKEEIEKYLGEDVYFLIKIAMIEQAGLNLRNKIAHGLITQSDITESNCTLIVYLFLILTRYNGEEE